MNRILMTAALVLLAGCDRGDLTQENAAGAMTDSQGCANASEHGMALYGDVHVHTSYSFDAAAISTGATPEDAHRYARGEEIPFFPLSDAGEPMGTTRIDRPLDFLAVTDHGEFLGERALCSTNDSPSFSTAFCEQYRSDQRVGMMLLGNGLTVDDPQRAGEICGEDGGLCLDFARSPWRDIQDAANAAYEPCEFTSFIAYEYTGTPGASNYHRNVIFRDGNVPALPVSYLDAPLDSELWKELDAVCQGDCDYLTIPHNSNLATGRMAPYKQLRDTLAAKRSYAELRLKREPIMEIFQHKGGSECINGLSTVLGVPDELCDIEQVRPLGDIKVYAGQAEDGVTPMGTVRELITECAEGEVGNNGMRGAGCVHATDFQRSALVVGLKEEQATGRNPIKLGVIASTDSHMATAGNVAEDRWTGAVTGESTPAERLQPGVLATGIDGNPGGLAGVWAKENTREAIFDAMLRREVFGTSGPRISVRLFAGWDYDVRLCDAPDMLELAYGAGVPMGSDLPGGEGKPRLLAYAGKDPLGQDLTELHLVKGWVDADGVMRTKVIPVMREREGAATLCTVYTDESFDPEQPAYYYLRAVEPPTPRWHAWDCARIAVGERPAVCRDRPGETREMAWSSPIWYRPDGAGPATTTP